MAKGKKKGGSSHSSMRDKMRERATTREQQGRGGVKFNFPEGQEVKFLKIDKACTKKLDFLPYEITVDKHPAGVSKGDLWYQRTIWVHNGVGPEEKAYLCLKTIGKKCPICDYAAQLQKDPKADEELIKSLRAKEREVFNVIDLGSDSDEILLWEFSYHLFGKLLEDEIRNAEPEEDFKAGFADLEGGSTLKVRFESKKMGKNEFFEAKRIDFMDRDDYPESILEDVLNLDEILNVLPYDKLEGIFLDTDPEPEEKPRNGKKSKDEDDKKRSSKKKEVDIDDLDLDELKEYIEEHDLDIKVTKKMDEDDVRDLIREAQSEDEEEEAPRRGGKSKKKDDEEEEDEKPKRGGRSSRGKKDEEEDEEPPRRGKKNDKKKSKKSDDDEPECPAGGTYGEDEGEHDECMDCECWDECKVLSKKKSGKKSRR